MFEAQREYSTLGSAAMFGRLVYHNTVRSVRKGHGNALWSIGQNMLQTLLMVGIFYFMFSFFGLRQIAIRGDFLLYMMSGVFLFMVHIKALGAVAGSEGPASPMMQHLPMTTAVAICSAALGSLYIQTLSMVFLLFLYHITWTPVVIDDPVGAYAMVLLSWFSGASIGMIFLALKPWFPEVTSILTQLFQRANMFASGKMFVANTMSSAMLALFSWNPLFHTIDQARGFVFINYSPMFSSIGYPIYVSLGALMVGLMGEFYTRKHASISWSARR